MHFECVMMSCFEGQIGLMQKSSNRVQGSQILSKLSSGGSIGDTINTDKTTQPILLSNFSTIINQIKSTIVFKYTINYLKY